MRSEHQTTEVGAAAVVAPEAGYFGDLPLGHILAAAELDPSEVVVIRHTYGEDGLRASDIRTETVLATRVSKAPSQGTSSEERLLRSG